MLQSLFLAAIGESRDRGAAQVEAFSYRYPDGESAYERFRVHKTVFPADFLTDFGFRTVRVAGRVGLARLELGAFGTVYYDGDGRVLGSMQYGPAPLFPRAYELPAGPPSDDAVLVTCAYLVDSSAPWVMQSLFLAAIGEARDRDFACVEAFAYRYQEGESAQARFREHRTVFPADFLGDFGFRVVRTSGRVGLARLELGGLVPVEEGRRARVLRVVKEAFLPEPVPAPRP